MINASKIRYFLQKNTFFIKFVYPIIANLYRQDCGYTLYFYFHPCKMDCKRNT